MKQRMTLIVLFMVIVLTMSTGCKTNTDIAEPKAPTEMKIKIISEVFTGKSMDMNGRYFVEYYLQIQLVSCPIWGEWVTLIVDFGNGQRQNLSFRYEKDGMPNDIEGEADVDYYFDNGITEYTVSVFDWKTGTLISSWKVEKSKFSW